MFCTEFLFDVVVECFQVKIAEPLRCEISQRNAFSHLLNNFFQFIEHRSCDADFLQYLQRSGDVVKCYASDKRFCLLCIYLNACIRQNLCNECYFVMFNQYAE
nr:MAG: hypothetical protein [Bacteriophage sp.]